MALLVQNYPHTMRVLHTPRSFSSITQFYISLQSHRSIISPNSQNISQKPSFFSQFSNSPRRLTSMAGESESFATAVTSADDENTKFGFERDEMYKNNLAGSVHHYERHVFLCYKSHDSWPPNVENSESDPLPKLFASTLKARQKEINVKTRLTIFEGGDDVKLSDGDVVIFPEMIIYRGLKETNVDSFVEDVLVNGKTWVSGVQEKLTGSFVFVCAHNNRDRRCGVCGPVLIEKFKEEIESKGLINQVFVAACSHIGGHKYAGNVITFSANTEGKIAGNWYGYVTPTDVLELLDQQIGKGEVIERLWRGQMDAPIQETEKVEEVVKLVNGTNVNHIAEQPQENGGCCQGVNGFSCCRDEKITEKTVKPALGGLSIWTGKWEQREVLTTLALAGAIATVAVAYAFYRRAR